MMSRRCDIRLGIKVFPLLYQPREKKAFYSTRIEEYLMFVLRSLK